MTNINAAIKQLLEQGTVIPACPLALTSALQIDVTAQKQLIQYYIRAGAGGLAVGVHTTQFEIRDPAFQLFEPILELASKEIDAQVGAQPFLKIAGICGSTEQAIQEAKLAVKYGYHLGLLSMGNLAHYSEEDLLNRTRAVSEHIPIFGFYLQPAVGGRKLSYAFWEAFAEIPNVLAIKVAAFNRYQTLDVVKAVAHSSRNTDISLYTGNDDNIVPDLLTTYKFHVNGIPVQKRFVGGLLGHWAVWTGKAVELLADIKKAIDGNYDAFPELLQRGAAITDMNAALFDAANNFKGSIAGIHEVLRRMGLLSGIYCLNPEEKLSPGQLNEIDKIYSQYGDLMDDFSTP